MSQEVITSIVNGIAGKDSSLTLSLQPTKEQIENNYTELTILSTNEITAYQMTHHVLYPDIHKFEITLTPYEGTNEVSPYYKGLDKETYYKDSSAINGEKSFIQYVGPEWIKDLPIKVKCTDKGADISYGVTWSPTKYDDPSCNLDFKTDEIKIHDISSGGFLIDVSCNTKTTWYKEATFTVYPLIAPSYKKNFTLEQKYDYVISYGIDSIYNIDEMPGDPDTDSSFSVTASSCTSTSEYIEFKYDFGASFKSSVNNDYGTVIAASNMDGDQISFAANKHNTNSVIRTVKKTYSSHYDSGDIFTKGNHTHDSRTKVYASRDYTVNVTVPADSYTCNKTYTGSYSFSYKGKTYSSDHEFACSDTGTVSVYANYNQTCTWDSDGAAYSGGSNSGQNLIGNFTLTYNSTSKKKTYSGSYSNISWSASQAAVSCTSSISNDVYSLSYPKNASVGQSYTTITVYNTWDTDYTCDCSDNYTQSHSNTTYETVGYGDCYSCCNDYTATGTLHGKSYSIRQDGNPVESISLNSYDVDSISTSSSSGSKTMSVSYNATESRSYNSNSLSGSSSVTFSWSGSSSGCGSSSTTATGTLTISGDCGYSESFSVSTSVSISGASESFWTLTDQSTTINSPVSANTTSVDVTVAYSYTIRFSDGTSTTYTGNSYTGTSNTFSDNVGGCSPVTRSLSIPISFTDACGESHSFSAEGYVTLPADYKSSSGSLSYDKTYNIGACETSVTVTGTHTITTNYYYASSTTKTHSFSTTIDLGSNNAKGTSSISMYPGFSVNDDDDECGNSVSNSGQVTVIQAADTPTTSTSYELVGPDRSPSTIGADGGTVTAYFSYKVITKTTYCDGSGTSSADSFEPVDHGTATIPANTSSSSRSYSYTVTGVKTGLTCSFMIHQDMFRVFFSWI